MKLELLKTFTLNQQGELFTRVLLDGRVVASDALLGTFDLPELAAMDDDERKAWLATALGETDHTASFEISRPQILENLK